jgi:hypothetical protein
MYPSTGILKPAVTAARVNSDYGIEKATATFKILTQTNVQLVSLESHINLSILFFLILSTSLS